MDRFEKVNSVTNWCLLLNHPSQAVVVKYPCLSEDLKNVNDSCQDIKSSVC